MVLKRKKITLPHSQSRVLAGTLAVLLLLLGNLCSFSFAGGTLAERVSETVLSPWKSLRQGDAWAGALPPSPTRFPHPL